MPNLTVSSAVDTMLSAADNAGIRSSINLGASDSPSFAGLSVPNFSLGYTTTVTSAGTLTLTAASNNQQFFTGTTTHTVVLPVASTMTVGQRFILENNSTGVVTVNSSGGNLVVAIVSRTSVKITCILASGTNAASWDVEYVGSITPVVVGTTAGTLAAGDDSRFALINRYVKNFKPRSIIFAGDSISASSDVTSSVTNSYNPNSWFALGAMQTGMSVIRNAGVGGNTSTNLAARFSADVLAYSPDACAIMIGTNDYTSGGGNSIYSTLGANLATMIRQCLAANILPILVVPPPKNSAIPEAKRGRLFIYRVAEAYRLPLIDLYTQMVDVTNGQYLSGYSGDGTHPQAAGLAAITTTVKNGLSDLASIVAPQYYGVVDEGSGGELANLIVGGNFSGGAPNYWTVNLTNASVALTTATLPSKGRTFQYTKTVSGGAYALYGSTITLVPGNRYRLSGKLIVSGMTYGTSAGINFGLEVFGSAGFQRLISWSQNGTFYPTIEFTAGTGQTSAVFTMYTAEACVLTASDLTLVNLTAADAIYQPVITG